MFIDGFDGHCQRAYAYWPEKMPKITSMLDEVNKGGKVFKITSNDGHITYLNEHNPELLKYKEN